jgi:hypothetical protein
MRLIPRLALVVVAMAPLAAEASDPNSIYTVPTEVQILPDDATGTRVVIGGAFFLLSSPATFTYGEPRCGYMSFQCPAGKELMCRMQWLDVRKAIGAGYCAGFGTWGMVSTATLHPDRGGLATPDPWDLGMGISVGYSVDQKCPKALMLKCAAPLPDAGPADAAVVVPPPDSAPPPSDVPAVDAPSPAPDAAVAAASDAAAVAAPDAAVSPPPAKSSGCSFGGGGGGVLSLLAALLALGRRARRR